MPALIALLVARTTQTTCHQRKIFSDWDMSQIAMQQASKHRCRSVILSYLSHTEWKLTRKQLLVSKFVVPLSPLRSKGALLSSSNHRLVSLSEGFHSELRKKKSPLAIAVLISFCTFAEQNNRGAVVQLVRIPACHAGGQGFESRPHRSDSSYEVTAF